MGNKTVLKENLHRTIKFDENYLTRLDNFLKSNFSKVFYKLKTNKRSLNKKIELNDFVGLIKEIDNEKIEYIEVYTYKDIKEDKDYYGAEDLCIIFRKLNILANVEYEYRDRHENYDIGFLEKLNKFLKTSRHAYAFLFDDGAFPFYWKFIFLQISIIGISLYLGFLFLNFINEDFGFNLPTFVTITFPTSINSILNCFFPKLTFALTEKEKKSLTKYKFINKLLLWFLGGIFFIFLGALIDRYFLKSW